MIRSAASSIKEELMPLVQGMVRDQVALFPPSLVEYISADNPVRFIDGSWINSICNG